MVPPTDPQPRRTPITHNQHPAKHVILIDHTQPGYHEVAVTRTPGKPLRCSCWRRHQNRLRPSECPHVVLAAIQFIKLDASYNR